MDFYQDLVRIEGLLVNQGYSVLIPQSAKVMKEKNDYEVSHVKGVLSYAERAQFIKKNFDEIRESDAILVINNDKHGMKNYIGPNVLMEIALAFYFGKRIYILNPIEPNSPYLEELRCFGVEELNGDLEQLHV